jgi:hypothetical protein
MGRERCGIVNHRGTVEVFDLHMPDNGMPISGRHGDPAISFYSAA